MGERQIKTIILLIRHSPNTTNGPSRENIGFPSSLRIAIEHEISFEVEGHMCHLLNTQIDSSITEHQSTEDQSTEDQSKEHNFNHLKKQSSEKIIIRRISHQKIWFTNQYKYSIRLLHMSAVYQHRIGVT